MNAVPGPLVLVVRDGGDLVNRSELALGSVPFVRIRSCVAEEVAQVAAALQPAVIIAASGALPLLTVSDTAVLAVRPQEHGEELRSRIIETIGRTFTGSG